MKCKRFLHVVVVALVLLPWVIPAPGWALASLGTGRGTRGVELSLDEGKTWLPFGAHALPILDGAQLRSTSGGASVDLTDGSQVHLFPFSAVRFHEIGSAIEIALLHGRLVFQLPVKTRVDLRTPSARLHPVREQVMVGEVFANGSGTTGLRMAKGSLQVQELSGGRREFLASLEPVILPKPLTTPAALFSSSLPAAPPRGAKAVFNPSGESLGYLGLDGHLVISPGFTASLTHPFSPRLLQLAMARVPEKDRREAFPLFDVNGGYVGYVAGSVFYAQAQISQAQVAQAIGGAETGIATLADAGAALGAAAIPVAFGFLVDTGGGGGAPVLATALRPKR